jgi:hypothetical protein
MIKELQKYLFNKKKVEGSKIKQMLGSDAALKEFANFWERHGETLMLVTAVKLHDFTHEQSFERIELDFYRNGLAEIGTFFADCSRLVELEKEAEKNNKK